MLFGSWSSWVDVGEVSLIHRTGHAHTLGLSDFNVAHRFAGFFFLFEDETSWGVKSLETNIAVDQNPPSGNLLGDGKATPAVSTEKGFCMFT